MTQSQKEAVLSHIVRNAVVGADQGEFDSLFDAEGLDEDAADEALVAFRQEAVLLAESLVLP